MRSACSSSHNSGGSTHLSAVIMRQACARGQGGHIAQLAGVFLQGQLHRRVQVKVRVRRWRNGCLRPACMVAHMSS